MAHVSLVTNQHLSKTDALSHIERVLGVRADRSDPANPVIHLDGGAKLTIEVPKFGEDLPLTLDIHHEHPHLAKLGAEAVKTALIEGLMWGIETVGEVLL